MQKREFKQHFSIRKLTIGAASVLIGTSFYLAGANVTRADVVQNNNSDVQVASVQANNDTAANTNNANTNSVNSTNTNATNTNNTNSANTNTNDTENSQESNLISTTSASGNTDNDTQSLNAKSVNTDSKNMTFKHTVTNTGDASAHRMIAVSVVPNKGDGKSEFDTSLTGPAEIENKQKGAFGVTNKYVESAKGVSIDDLVTDDGRLTKLAETAVSADSVKNWDDVRAVITQISTLKANSSVTIKLNTQDKTLENDVEKSVYMSSAVFPSKAAEIVINYMDTSGKQIASLTFTGQIGDKFDHELPDWSKQGYHVVGGQIPTEFGKAYAVYNVILKHSDISTNTSNIDVNYHGPQPSQFLSMLALSPNVNFGNLNDSKIALKSNQVELENNVIKIKAGDANSAKLTVVGKSTTGVPLVQPSLPAAEIPAASKDPEPVPDPTPTPDPTPNPEPEPSPVPDFAPTPEPTPDTSVKEAPIKEEPVKRTPEKVSMAISEFPIKRDNPHIPNAPEKSTHTADAATIMPNVNAQPKLPQTGEKNADPTIYSAFAISLGLDLLVASYDSKRKRKQA